MNQFHRKAPLADILTDVSIREGSQQDIDLRNTCIDTKLDLMTLAIESGVKRIELTAFAPGQWFNDAEKLVCGALFRLTDPVILRALYFNTNGLSKLIKYQRILQEGIFFTAATAKYREKNYRQQSTDHAEVKMKRIIASFKKHGLKFNTLVMSTAWGECDEVSLEEQTLDYLTRLLSSAKNQGFPVHSITLADTMGCAKPEAIHSLINRVKIRWPDILIRTHLHPMPGTDEECIHAAMGAGVDFWEASWCGLGGSPFADKAGGNLDIRWLIRVYNTLNLEHGFDEEAVNRIVHFLRKYTRRDIPDILL